jgi:hypothetical protein
MFYDHKVQVELEVEIPKFDRDLYSNLNENTNEAGDYENLEQICYSSGESNADQR